LAINTPDGLIQENPLSLQTYDFLFKKHKFFALSGPSLLVKLKLKGKFGFLGYLLENTFFLLIFYVTWLL